MNNVKIHYEDGGFTVHIDGVRMCGEVGSIDEIRRLRNHLAECPKEEFYEWRSGAAKHAHEAVKARAMRYYRRIPKGTYVPTGTETLESVCKVLETIAPEYIGSVTVLDGEFVALVANAANMLAKTVDYSFYDEKDTLTHWLARWYRNSWSRGDGILYCETIVGQVSFHVFDGQDIMAMVCGLDPSSRVWDDNDSQARAEELLSNYFTIKGVQPFTVLLEQQLSCKKWVR